MNYMGLSLNQNNNNYYYYISVKLIRNYYFCDCCDSCGCCYCCCDSYCTNYQCNYIQHCCKTNSRYNIMGAIWAASIMEVTRDPVSPSSFRATSWSYPTMDVWMKLVIHTGKKEGMRREMSAPALSQERWRGWFFCAFTEASATPL